MAKRSSWYFEGYEAHYEIDETGKRKRVLEYTGPLYGLGITGPAYRRVKALIAAEVLGYVACLLLVNFFPGQLGMVRWVGVPCLWALVPAIFMVMGLFNFLTVGEKWMTRQWYAGFRRIQRWSVAALVLMVWVAVAHIVLMVRYPSCFPGELPYLLGVLACIALLVALLWYGRRHPVQAVEGPKIR